MPTTSLDTGDAVELAEMLQFVDDWLATDPGELGASRAHRKGSCSGYRSPDLTEGQVLPGMTGC